MADPTSESDQNPQALLASVHVLHGEIVEEEKEERGTDTRDVLAKSKKLMSSILFAELDEKVEELLHGRVSQNTRIKLQSLAYTLSHAEVGSSNFTADIRAVLKLPLESASAIPELPDDLQHAYTISSKLPPDTIRVDPTLLSKNVSVMGATAVITPSEAAETNGAAATPVVPPTFAALLQLRSQMLKHAGGYDAVSWGDP